MSELLASHPYPGGPRFMCMPGAQSLSEDLEDASNELVLNDEEQVS